MDALRGAAVPQDDVLTVWGGDLNMQPLAPRDHETLDAAAWHGHLHAHGAATIVVDGPTHIGRHGESQIDVLGCSATVVDSYRTRKAWRLPLSDHAILYADPAASRQRRRDDSIPPWMYKSLPPEALCVLRGSVRCAVL